MKSLNRCRLARAMACRLRVSTLCGIPISFRVFCRLSDVPLVWHDRVCHKTASLFVLDSKEVALGGLPYWKRLVMSHKVRLPYYQLAPTAFRKLLELSNTMHECSL